MAKSTTSKSEPPTLGAIARDGVIVIEVGPEQEQYHIHKALLIHHSDYFRKALGGPWKEAQEGIIRLDDIQPTVVNLFVHWLYTNQLPKPHEWAKISRILDADIHPFVAEVQAHAFADRFLVPEFRRVTHNSLVDAVEKSSFYIGVSEMLEMAQAAFATIPPERPILQLLVDTHCNWWMQCCEDAPDAVNKLPRAFLVRAMRMLDDARRSERAGRTEKKKRCYYEHASEEEQKACPHEHMQYDKEKDFGFFGKRFACEPLFHGKLGE